MNNEELNKGLDEFAHQTVIKLVPTLGQKFSNGRYVGGTRDYFTRDEFIGLVKAGAEWMKEQMMKEAVEGYILGETRNQEDKPYEIYAESDFLPLNGKFKMGDRVKLIIVKKD